MLESKKVSCCRAVCSLRLIVKGKDGFMAENCMVLHVYKNLKKMGWEGMNHLRYIVTKKADLFLVSNRTVFKTKCVGFATTPKERSSKYQSSREVYKRREALQDGNLSSHLSTKPLSGKGCSSKRLSKKKKSAEQT